jgi:hypothetical protein
VTDNKLILPNQITSKNQGRFSFVLDLLPESQKAAENKISIPWFLQNSGKGDSSKLWLDHPEFGGE